MSDMHNKYDDYSNFISVGLERDSLYTRRTDKHFQQQ